MFLWNVLGDDTYDPKSYREKFQSFIEKNIFPVRAII